MNKLFKFIFAGILALTPCARPAIAQVPVIDGAAIAELITQITKMVQIIRQLQTLNGWQNIDHLNIGDAEFATFLSQYRDLFNQVLEKINSFKDGGMFGQIERLDEIFFPYNEAWSEQDRPGNISTIADPLRAALKQQILWTNIQMKHAAEVGAKIRDTLPQTQEQINSLLSNTHQAAGVMQALKTGNELSGMVGKSMQTLNYQLNEFLQAYSAKNLEENQIRGLQMNRQYEAIQGLGEQLPGAPLPLNPVGAY